MSELSDSILDILKDSTADIWQDKADADFLREVAEEIKGQYLLIAADLTDEQRAAHRKNIEFWKVAVLNRLEQKDLKIRKDAEPIFRKILDVLIGAVRIYLAGQQ